MSRFVQVDWRGVRGPVLEETLRHDDGTQPSRHGQDAGGDVLVVAPSTELGERDRARVGAGCGLVVTGSGVWAPSLRALVARWGLGITDREPERSPLVPATDAVPGADGQDLLARVVDPVALTGAQITVADGAAALLHSTTGGVVAAVAARPSTATRDDDDRPLGRVAVVTADLGEETWSTELLHNVVTWAAPEAPEAARSAGAAAAAPPAWYDLKDAVGRLQPLQAADGSLTDPADLTAARAHLADVVDAVERLAPDLPHDAEYLAALVADLLRWSAEGLGVPDFLDSLVAFQPQRQRVDGLRHLVVFPMYTQNGSRERHLEAVLVEVVWPDFVAELEAGDYSNRLFVPIRFVDFTAGYDSNSAVLFPETVAMRAVPTFTWGAIFADREAARFRRVVRAAAATTGLALPPDAARLVADQQLAEETFVMWDLIHDRTHMRGDLPFDPFMIKQRMPYFLYALEELRCDLTAFRESVTLERRGVPHARLVQYAVVFDRIFRFAVTGPRVRNYDGLGGQLLFAWLHQHHVLHWTDNRLTIDWHLITDAVLALGREIEDLYWRSIDRPKISHWLAAYDLVSATVTPHPASVWAKGPDALPLDGPLKLMTDAVLPDEFPLSMFYEALSRRIGDVVASTSGITATSAR